MNITIRSETENDFREVEELTREAFWNLHAPGCDEHYLVHEMRNHPDFIPDLDFVAILDGRIVGNIMYAKSRLVDKEANVLPTITFGPVSVIPGYQRKGIGSSLIRHSIDKAVSRKHKAIIIEGHPYNYCKHGFKGSKDYNISNAEGKFPLGLLVLELEKGCLDGHAWKFHQSDVYAIDTGAAEMFDKTFEFKKKEYRYTQEEFRIASRAYIE
jgi:putative acetyltransferase